LVYINDHVLLKCHRRMEKRHNQGHFLRFQKQGYYRV
jgi:hypothetical protein